MERQLACEKPKRKPWNFNGEPLKSSVKDVKVKATDVDLDCIAPFWAVAEKESHVEGKKKKSFHVGMNAKINNTAWHSQHGREAPWKCTHNKSGDVTCVYTGVRVEDVTDRPWGGRKVIKWVSDRVVDVDKAGAKVVSAVQDAAQVRPEEA